ncbi:hypothetical protein [Croceicoccus estronivorus]|uniref:hypothetical protein n=1 Tax=Croceicoccus estronivorus TaxID=1172626 RepID=UPI0012E923D5|nr:hypothetical protein [Croceicoccus estronivorus]
MSILSSPRRWFLVFATLALALLAAHNAALSWWRVQTVSEVPVWAQDATFALRATMTPLALGETPVSRAARMREAARAVLRTAPLDPAAPRQLGLADELAGKGSGLAQLRLAERLSRRDLPTQLALIEQEAQAGDLPATLLHYDRALTVHPASEDQLLPLLAVALDDADIRAALVPYADRPWFSRLARRAISQGADPLALARLLQAIRQTDGRQELADTLWPIILAKLISSGQVNDARTLAGNLPGQNPQALNQLGFSKAATNDPRLGPLGWRMTGEGPVAASFNKPGQLAIRVASNRSGVVTERVTLLPPGRYRVMQDITYPATGPKARLTWGLRCLGKPSRQLDRHSLPAASGSRTHTFTLTIPADCPAQAWQLSATATLAQSDSEVQLTALSLKRL